jgi:UPF0755 protein
MSEEAKNPKQPEEIRNSTTADETTKRLPELPNTDRTEEPAAGEEWAGFDWEQGFFSWERSVIEEDEQKKHHLQEPAVPVPEPAPEKETKKPVKRKKRTIRTLPESILAAMIYVVGVLVISFVFATVGWKWANDFLALDKPEKTVSITISEGETVEQLADELQEQGLIEYKFLFKLFAGLTKKSDRITSGTYELNTEMDYSALLNNISSTSVYRETVTVTLLEGSTMKEIFQLLEDSGVCSVEKLTASAEEDEFDYSFLDDVERTGAERLEGYLFPDTYEFYKGAEAKSVLNKMLSNFNDRFTEEMEVKAETLGYSKDDILIIASIIEKETTGEDRRDIASVIYNRLKNPDHDDISGHLQMDSTVQYILPERKEHLTDEDISIESPYNTYLVTGLPVGPICSPGLTSIQAALEPNQTNYYYFMLGDDGEDHFFTDGSSFNAFKAAQTGNQDEEE